MIGKINGGGPRSERRTALDSNGIPIHTLVVLLCIVSGSLDAISFLALGQAFASVMTGNIVFLGVAAGTVDATLAKFCGFALTGYIVGSFVGSRLGHRWDTRDNDSIWPNGVTKTLMIQWFILIIASISWLCISGKPAHWQQIIFLCAASCAMGIQSGAIRKVGLKVSTTYMTGALTTLIEAISTRRRYTHTESSAGCGLIALAIGALLGSLTLTYFPSLVFFVPVGALGGALLVRVIASKRNRNATPDYSTGHSVY